MILGLQLEYSKLLLAEKILKVSAFMPLSSFCPATNWESGLKLNSATSLQLCCSTFALRPQQTHTHSVTGNVRDPRARWNIHCPQITPVLLLCQCVSGTFFKKQGNFNVANCYFFLACKWESKNQLESQQPWIWWIIVEFEIKFNLKINLANLICFLVIEMFSVLLQIKDITAGNFCCI